MANCSSPYDDDDNNNNNNNGDMAQVAMIDTTSVIEDMVIAPMCRDLVRPDTVTVLKYFEKQQGMILLSANIKKAFHLNSGHFYTSAGQQDINGSFVNLFETLEVYDLRAMNVCAAAMNVFCCFDRHNNPRPTATMQPLENIINVSRNNTSIRFTLEGVEYIDPATDTTFYNFIAKLARWSYRQPMPTGGTYVAKLFMVDNKPVLTIDFVQ
jgi:hypothetical protein